MGAGRSPVTRRTGRGGVPVTLPSLHRLRVFTVIVDAGSVSSGARELGITQSTASTHLRQLEAEVGSLLIERTGRQFKLTEAGEVLLAHAYRMLAIADEALGVC